MGERQSASFQTAVDDFIMYALGGKKKNQASSRFGPSHLNKIQLSIFSEYVVCRKVPCGPLKKLTRYILRSSLPVDTMQVYSAMNKYTTQSCNIAHMYIQYSPLPKSSFDQLLMCVTFWLEMVQHVSLYSTQRSIAVLAEAELGQYFKKAIINIHNKSGSTV